MKQKQYEAKIEAKAESINRSDKYNGKCYKMADKDVVAAIPNQITYFVQINVYTV